MRNKHELKSRNFHFNIYVAVWAHSSVYFKVEGSWVDGPVYGTWAILYEFSNEIKFMGPPLQKHFE